MLFTRKDRQKIKNAFEEYNKRVCAAMPDESELPPLSEKLEERLEKHIRKHSEYAKCAFKRNARRTAVIVAVIILATVITCFSVIAGSETVRNFIINIFDNSSQIEVDTPEDVTRIETVYGLSALPEEYSLKSSEKYNMATFEFYINDSGDMIKFSQTVAKGTTLGINTENGYSEKVVLEDGEEALYYYIGNDSGIVFTRDGYLFEIIAPLDKSEILDLANNIIAK